MPLISIFLLCVLKLDQRLGKTATSKLLKGISVGKFKSLPGQKGQYFFGGKDVHFSLPDE